MKGIRSIDLRQRYLYSIWFDCAPSAQEDPDKGLENKEMEHTRSSGASHRQISSSKSYTHAVARNGESRPGSLARSLVPQELRLDPGVSGLQYLSNPAFIYCTQDVQ